MSRMLSTKASHNKSSVKNIIKNKLRQEATATTHRDLWIKKLWKFMLSRSDRNSCLIVRLSPFHLMTKRVKSVCLLMTTSSQTTTRPWFMLRWGVCSIVHHHLWLFGGLHWLKARNIIFSMESIAARQKWTNVHFLKCLSAHIYLDLGTTIYSPVTACAYSRLKTFCWFYVMRAG